MLMAPTCPTTEAALQAGRLPARVRQHGRFAKICAFLFSDGLSQAGRYGAFSVAVFTNPMHRHETQYGCR